MAISFCPSCDASNRRDSRFCGECGASLIEGAEEDQPVHPARTRVRRGDVHVRKAGTRHKIRSAAQAIGRVRLFFFFLGCLTGLAFVIMLLGLSQVDSGVISPGEATFMLAMLGLPTLLSFVGAWRAQRHPLPWALGLAGLLTVNCILGPALIPILLTIAAWGFVGPILKLQKLIKENPEDPGLASLLEGGSRRRGRRRSGLAGDFGKAALILVAFLFVLFGSIYGAGAVRATASEPRTYSVDDQPDELLGPTVARLERAWREGDFEAMGEFYHPRMRAVRGSRLKRRFDQRELTPPLPSLQNRQIVNYRRMQQLTTWRTSIGTIEAVFEYSDDQWFMIALRFP